MRKLVFIVFVFCTVFTYAQNEEIYEIIEEEEDLDTKMVPFAVIDEVPIHPKCESKITNQEKKQCFNLMMRKHIQRHFNAELGSCLKKELVLNEKTKIKEEKCTSSLSIGKKRIYVQFKIGMTGEIEEIHVRAPHPKLKEEAIRIAKLLPVMKPGKLKGKPVRVGYTLPITFNVE